MLGRKNGEVPPRLSRAAARFAKWRRTRALGTRIPESLWALAVELATSYGVCPTAATLKLNYYDLKKRVAANASPSGRSDASSPSPTFIELAGPTLGTSGEWVIECENAAGSKLRIHLKGSHVPDLLALSGSLWNSSR